MTANMQPVTQRVWLVYALFIAASFAGFFYCLILGQFNGDFFPQPVFAPIWTLFFVLIVCVLPHLLTYRLAGVLDKIRPRYVYEPAQGPLFALLLIGSLSHIAATLLYGVGIMDREVYTAPTAVAPFIQVLNRVDPFYLGVFFILATPKRPSSDLLAIVLMITIGFLRAGLGVFNYVFIALAVKYSVELMTIFRRAPWVAVAAGAALPLVISPLYELRNQLRGHSQFDLSMSEIIFGRFIGRLSAYSNVAFINQNGQSFDWAARALEPLFYVKQMLQPMLGSGIAPAMTPEKLLIAGTQSYEGYSSFMTGMPGNFIMAWSLSPGIAVLNLSLTIAMICAILWISRFLHGGAASAFGLSMLVYPLTSGVANEFSLLLMNTVILLAFSIAFGRRRVAAGVVARG
ncbi:oligosaccharide repeat unit polymerase [Sphingomonas lycopersici]|uniref:Oligosaccharide repeat unit polymerase n=1 Tax=Sphingomonas lycopersici TaxID=2951807 RepID=A0AA42CW09_9SPHN|nr:oligosaccharide repeat unit polymerase [Sphingomonas lycopersici]MCW6537273.1 oligosaccharide repeat unit polymerase [Sphingomonas lycopersici]